MKIFFTAGHPPMQTYRNRLLLLLSALLLLPALGWGQGVVVISQVYGGGGNASTVYTNDFIELHNISNTAVSVDGWSVQYSSATGTTWAVTNLGSAVIPAGGYYLVQEAAGSLVTNALPTPDAIGTIAMAAGAGKVALVNTTATLPAGCPTGATVVDYVGYGSTANCSKVAPTATLTNTTAAIRNGSSGSSCTNAGNNSTDFAAGAPTPRNSSANSGGTAPFTCSAGPSVNTGAVSGISTSGATVAGEALVVAAAAGSAAPSARGVVYSTTVATPTLATGTAVPAGTSGTGSYSVALSALLSGTLYYVTAYATNTSGTAYGVTVSFTTTALPPSNTVATGPISPASYCVGSAGAAVAVPFTSTGTFAAGNVYTAYIGATAIGTASAVGTINAVIPATVASGSAYRIRVDASSPATTGQDNGADLTIVNYQTNNVTAYAATPGNGQVALAWTNPATCTDDILIVAKAAGSVTGTPSGNAYSANATFGAGTAFGGGFVVYQGTGGAATITGLTNGTVYYFKAFSRVGNDYSNGIEVTTTPFIPTYTWSGVPGANWSAANSWTPNRSSPTATDVLIFNGATMAAPSINVPVNAAANQAAQIQFINNVSATFSTNDAPTLVVSGNSNGDDFVVAAGSTITFSAGSNADRIRVTITTGATAAIGGVIAFAATTATLSVQHRIVGNDASAVRFLNGSVLRVLPGFGGQALGVIGTNGVVAGSTVFEAGATYHQEAGGSPFGTTTASVVTFQAGSTYEFAALSGVPDVSGRQFGNLVFQLSNPDTDTGTGITATNTITILNDLRLTSAVTGAVYFRNASNINIGGNIVVDGGTLTFASPNPTVRTVALNGTTPQLIGGTVGTTGIAFNANVGLQINNPTGVTLARPLTLARLQLTSGLLTTDAASLLTLSAIPVLSGGSATSFINGPLARITATGPAITVFPIGKGTAYRPLTLTTTAQTASTTYTGEIVNASARTSGLSGTLTRVSNIRYATLVPDFALATGDFAGTVTLSFGPDDYANYPQDNTFVLAKREGSGAWQNIGHSAETGTSNGGLPVSGDLTSASFAGFPGSDFSLASTAPLGSNSLTTINPLPVELVRFDAKREAGGVRVTWATASELNSARFDVQRSFDGREFGTIATATASGTTTQPTAYATLDKLAPTARLYYRLRQVDLDGTLAYSPVVTVAGTDTPAGELALYPNPATDQLTATLPALAGRTYRVLNALGQVLDHGTADSANPAVDVRRLPAGIYFLELRSEAGQQVRRFVKSN